eukprot:Nitzschia sp. Nitz4//scaffold99_size76975//69606//71036//NITZ4_005587-RA/size76975-processed-gene-0.71-mRNA-1//-1//CDS//3329560883//3286//frame0
MSLDLLPHDVLAQIGGHYLSPRDRLALSSCSRQLRAALPLPLTIRLFHRQGMGSLQPRFFVSPWQEERVSLDQKESDLEYYSNCLLSYESLRYGQEYVFWTFDYTSFTPVYLGRHTRHSYTGALSPERNAAPGSDAQRGGRHCFTIAMRPGAPQQTWRVVGDSQRAIEGDVVVWGDVVGLMVCGRNPKGQQPDSSQRGMLSCFPPALAFMASHERVWFHQQERRTISTSDQHDDLAYPHNWAVLALEGQEETNEYDERVEWGKYEKLRLISCQRLWQLSHAATNTGNEEHLTYHRDPNRERSLIVAAIPDICEDGQYLMYTPWNKKGLPTCVGHHLTVDFQFWIQSGIKFFHAPVLPFSLAVPILETDGGSYARLEVSSWATRPIQTLRDIRSARWGSIVFYLAVAVDVSEGKSVQIDRFLARVTNHRDHIVNYIRPSQAVHIGVKDRVVRTTKEDGTPLTLPRTPRSLWKFTLCW